MKLPSIQLAKLRLLPPTIASIAALLLLKTLILVQAVAGETAPTPGHAPPHAGMAEADMTAGGSSSGARRQAPTPPTPVPAKPPSPEAAVDAASSGPTPTGPAAGPTKMAGADASAAPATPRPPAQDLPRNAAGGAPPEAVPTASPADIPHAIASASTASSSAMPANAAPVSDAERAILLDLRKRRDELEAREKTLDEREAEIKSADHRLSERVDQMGALQTKLESMETTREQHKTENWQGLVKIYEQMKPRDAAAIFDALDVQILLQVLDRMQERKAAPILAAMQPDRARLATQMLAEMRTRAVTPQMGNPAQPDPKG